MNYDATIDTVEEATQYNPLVESEEEDRKARRRVWLIVAAVFVAIAALWFWSKKDTAAPAAKDAGAQAPVVTVLSPGRQTIAEQINVTGSLAARREMPVGSVGEGGQIVQVLVEPGQWVKAGQTLAVIDRSVQVQQESSLAAQIQAAQAEAQLAQANLDRALKLVDRGFVSKADVDRLIATRDGANARVRVARAQLGEMKARTRRLNIVAPEAGLILSRDAEPGQVVSGGSGVLFRMAKGGEMEMLARVSEDELSQLSVGVQAEVTPVGSAKSFTGQVWQVSPIIDTQTRQGTARIALPYAPELRPGGFANAKIGSGTKVASMLPESAVLSDAKGSYVMIVGQDDKAERRDVTLGSVTDSGIVIASGLSGNERVVLRAGAFLTPGEHVKPRAAAR